MMNPVRNDRHRSSPIPSREWGHIDAFTNLYDQEFLPQTRQQYQASRRNTKVFERSISDEPQRSDSYGHEKFSVAWDMLQIPVLLALIGIISVSKKQCNVFFVLMTMDHFS